MNDNQISNKIEEFPDYYLYVCYRLEDLKNIVKKIERYMVPSINIDPTAELIDCAISILEDASHSIEVKYREASKSISPEEITEEDNIGEDLCSD